MRIVCPNCSAGYEIPNRAIPAEGREVQCSACAHAWYQLPQTSSPSSQKSSTGQVPPSTPTIHTDEEARDDEVSSLVPRRPLDPDVVSVLRQEATLETQARRTETSTLLETQPDLGLQQPPRSRTTSDTVGLRDRLARLQAAEKSANAQTWLPGAKGPEEPASAPETAQNPRQEPASGQEPKQEVEPVAAPARAPSDAPKNKIESTPKNSSISRQPKKPTPGLPVALSSTEIALIEEKKARKGFQLGFGLTAGAFGCLIALYVAAGFIPPEFPGAEAIQTMRSQGEILQGRAVAGLKSAVETATAQLIRISE